MEKYAKLMKGLEVCAGPECCKDGCPYYGETTGGMTCRARLLMDARIAIDNEQALHESAEEGLRNAVEELGKLNADVDDLEAANNTIRAERDGMRIELAKMAEERTTLLNEIHTMRHGETDRPSVEDKELMAEVCKMICEAKYQEGRADALAEIVERCSFGGGGRHE